MANDCACKCESYGAHLRSKNLKIGYAASARGADASTQKRWDAELEAYRDARLQGIQPAGTRMHQVRDALDKSDQLGAPYDASGGRGVD